MELFFHHLHHFNHWAVLVSALILWLLGAAWVCPILFAKPWMASLRSFWGFQEWHWNRISTGDPVVALA